ncbi:hypothetical protein LP420_33280 [Massilia sp. B-10]|nr:hypothetical protein LP420_33280 [Massilia sp. B-10]
MPDVPVQIAHLAAAGPGYNDPKADAVMGALAAAVEAGDPRTRNLWFDVTSVADKAITLTMRPRSSSASARLDWARCCTALMLRPATTCGPPTPGPPSALPLTDDEFAKIAANVAPYMR